MRARTGRVRRPARDYPTLAAVVAIIVSVAVLVGITYRYAGRSDPSDDLAARMSQTVGQKLPSEL
jgi:membrane protein implicated in regulation of membrane protease activity